MLHTWRKRKGREVIREGIVHDSLVANIDDMAAVGATESFQLTNCIDRNPLVIPMKQFKIDNRLQQFR